MVSPSALERVEETVEMTTSHPLQAFSNEVLSLKSPSVNEQPICFNAAIFSGDEVFLTSAFTGFCCAVSWRQISLPNNPVDPATSIINSCFVLRKYCVQFRHGLYNITSISGPSN